MFDFGTAFNVGYINVIYHFFKNYSSLFMWECMCVVCVGTWVDTCIQVPTYICAHACQSSRMVLEASLNYSSAFVHRGSISQSNPELTDTSSFPRPACSRDPLSLISMAGITGKTPQPPRIYMSSGEHKICSLHFLHGKHINHWSFSPARGLKI